MVLLCVSVNLLCSLFLYLRPSFVNLRLKVIVHNFCVLCCVFVRALGCFYTFTNIFSPSFPFYFMHVVRSHNWYVPTTHHDDLLFDHIPSAEIPILIFSSEDSYRKQVEVEGVACLLGIHSIQMCSCKIEFSRREMYCRKTFFFDIPHIFWILPDRMNMYVLFPHHTFVIFGVFMLKWAECTP